MTDLVRAAAMFQAELDLEGFPNCVIGGLALQAWGENRLTRDVDFTILTNFVDEPSKIQRLLQMIESRVPDPYDFAAQNRVILGVLGTGIPVDIGLGGFEYEATMVSRAVLVEFVPEVMLRVCTAEDLIVTKVFSGRERDWTDVRGIVERQAHLDWSQIRSDLSPLLEIIEEPARLARLESLSA